MKTGRKLTGPKAGFTILEVVAVLLIMGIISAVAISRMSDVDQIDLSSQVEVVKNHLRYAQSRAMSSGSEWGINFTSSTAYYLYNGANPNAQVSLPGEDNPLVNLSAKNPNMSITGSIPNGAIPGRIRFDGFGIPVDDNGVSLNSDITISTTGGNIDIRKNTGFVP
jgi:prepilin-type N-terminal cleavage/methylation domain-containing protein